MPSIIGPWSSWLRVARQILITPTYLCYCTRLVRTVGFHWHPRWGQWRRTHHINYHYTKKCAQSCICSFSCHCGMKHTSMFSFIYQLHTHLTSMQSFTRLSSMDFSRTHQICTHANKKSKNKSTTPSSCCLVTPHQKSCKGRSVTMPIA